MVLTASRKETAEKAVTQVKESCPDTKVEGIWPDLSSLESVKESFAKIHEKYGRIDILVNNAGMSDSAPFTNYTEDLFEKVMDLNVKGVFHASRAVVDYMVEQGSGVILSTSPWSASPDRLRGWLTRHQVAVNGFTISLARELGPKGIRVNAVAPGITETNMAKLCPKVIDPLVPRFRCKNWG